MASLVLNGYARGSERIDYMHNRETCSFRISGDAVFQPRTSLVAGTRFSGRKPRISVAIGPWCGAHM